MIEHWFFKRYVRRLISEQNHHGLRSLYRQISERASEIFYADNYPTLQSFLRARFEEALKQVLWRLLSAA